jgi:hypothetical protein
LLLLLCFAGCETTETGKFEDPEFWELGVLVGEPPAIVRLYPGTTSDYVIKLMDEPKTRTPDEANPGVETWFYDRRVQFGVGMRAYITKTTRGTFTNGRIYYEKAWITLRDGKVTDVRITRKREDVQVMSPFERSMKGR